MKRSPVILALALAACTGAGEPSADNIRDALAQSGNRGATRAEKLACKRSPERPGYVCDYRAPSCNRYTGNCGTVRPYTGRFLYAGGRWQLVEDLTRQAAPDPVTQLLPGLVPGSIAVAPAPSVAAVPLPSPTPTAIATAAAPDEPELSRKERRQIARWREADAQCRSGDRDACADRAERGDKLRGRGLCYGSPGAFGYDRAWRPCEGADR